MASEPTAGFLHGDVPFLRVGQGPPLIMAQGLSRTHEVPTGFERRMTLALAAGYAQHFTVYSVGRKRGLQPGESMSDIAGHLAAAVEHDLGEAVLLSGTSTGGSVALQLAADRPDLVRRLVVVAAACRLGAEGRAVQAELARLTRAGDAAGGWAHVMTATMPSPLRRLLHPLARLAMRSMAPIDPTDMLVTVDAEDVFDLEPDLYRITAPTLVVGGTKDPFYSRSLFEDTAAGVRDGRAHLFEGWGHMRTAASRATAHLTVGFLLAG